MNGTEAALLAEIETLRRAIATRDHTLLSMTRRMDQIIETIQAERDQLDQTVQRERELSQFVQQVLARMHDILIVTDPEGRIMQANAAAYRELGFAPETLPGVPVDVLLPPELAAAWRLALPDRPASASIWVATIARRGSYLEEHDLRNPQGTVAGIFRVSGEFLYNAQGKWVGVVFTASNFTQRKQAEQALMDSEARLQRMLDGSPVPLFVINQEHRVTHWNRACEALTGLPAAEMIGTQDQWRAFYDAPRPCLLDLVLDEASAPEIAWYYPGGIQERELAGRIREGEGFFPKLGNKWLFFTAAPIRDSQGGTVAAMESIQDITERKQHEAALRLAANVFEHAREGIIIADTTGTIVDVNQAFEEITGYSRDEVIGSNPKLLKSGHHDAAFYLEMWQAITERGYWHGEIWNRRKDGEIYPQSTSISAVHNAEGQVTYYVALFADISLLKESQRRLEQMAYYDPLTGLPNRALLADRLRLMLAKAQRERRLLAVCYLDLDGFKPVNDRWGHAAGDELLVQVAQRFQQSVRGDDTVARLGGDEFVILLGNLGSIEEGEQIIERILLKLGAPMALKAAEVMVSASIGVTFFPGDGADPDTLIRHADQAMYRAKQGGRSRYHLFDPERDRRAQIQRELLERIRQGWSIGEFCLYYQPKVDMRQGQILGMEALARWRHPDQGLLAPTSFIDVIEHSDFAPVFSDWVLETAIQQMAVWHSAGVTLPVSVNLSAHRLQEPDFALRLQSRLAHHPYVRPGWLEIEVLETTAREETQRVFQVMTECRRRGVRFAIDDFGMGYSSLAYLKQLPAHTLKIDRSFVRDMLFDPEDLAIVRAIVGLADAFRLEVIAEGVESAEQGTMLMNLGCDCAQGFVISRPMPGEEVLDWVRQWRKPAAWK